VRALHLHLRDIIAVDPIQDFARSGLTEPSVHSSPKGRGRGWVHDWLSD
jgi:hypothetical protein